MTLEEELLIHLNSNEETFATKLLHVENFFKSSELPARCKIILIKWILDQQNDVESMWKCLESLVSSNHFKGITRNEIDSQSIKDIVEGIIHKVAVQPEIRKNEYLIVKHLIDHKVFEQYFKFDLELYLNLINSILMNLNTQEYLLDFLNSNLFYKSLLNTEVFVKNFMNFIFPTLNKCLKKFDDKKVFLHASKVVQKCLFHNNRKNFENFVNEIFKPTGVEYSGFNIILEHLKTTIESNKKSSENQFKLLFHACLVSYGNDPLLTYKFFLILLHIIGFRYEIIPLTNNLISNNQKETKISYKILLDLLDVLEETKLETNCKINEVNITELLKTILTESIIPNKPSKTNYQIIEKTIQLDPAITQTLTEQILNYSLLVDNSNHIEQYEGLILTIFELFSKLHRTENLISKIVITLNNFFDNENNTDYLAVENVFTKNILVSFTKNIQTLASWQVINVFKTFLYALNKQLEKETTEDVYCLHMELLSELICTFLSSIRVAEHTVASNVVEKTKKCLQELQDILKTFGKSLLNKTHNCSLMRSFLKIAFHWAEMGIILKYYSSTQDSTQKKALEYNSMASNITYLHPYLTHEDWCSIAERINNFGEVPCKQLLYKLYTQKVRALCIFEQKLTNEVLADLSRYLTSDLENNWKDILQDKFLTNNLMPTLDPEDKLILAEKIVSNINDFGNVYQYAHVFNNASILNTVIYYIITKCDRILAKRKRKSDENLSLSKLISTRICECLDTVGFHDENILSDSIGKMSEIYKSSDNNSDLEIKFNEEKLLELVKILKHFPVIFCEANVQNFFILYFFSLHKDLRRCFFKGHFVELRKFLEDLIVGTLQQYKYKLANIFDIKPLCLEILHNFNEWKELFVLIIDNIFKYNDSIASYDSLIKNITNNLHSPVYLQCGIVIINAVNKLKKLKVPKEVKSLTENYKSSICKGICDLVLTSEPNDHLVCGYAQALKILFVQNEDEKLQKMLEVLNSYVNFALEKKEDFDKTGYLLLFNTVLNNKTKIDEFDDELYLKIWDLCKCNEKVFARTEEYSQLVFLMVCLMSNEQFDRVIEDLAFLSIDALKENNCRNFVCFLKTWESIISANINPVKTNRLQRGVESLLSNSLVHLESSRYDGELFENILRFEILLVQTKHLHLTPPTMDLLILSVTILLDKEPLSFPSFYNLLVSLLSNLLKFRKALVMDRLPPYLQQYRALLRALCLKGDSNKERNEHFVRDLSDCAYQLEKLTKSLVVHQKDMSRIAMYLVADILAQYEKVTIYPNIKMHLNNCIYSLITICDQHAVAYLMRVLSSASTEIFKVMYENYKKYYRFTGKA
ncbi:unnamed protein product [Phyllotreta striolata]|uniref:Nucleolar 27S pre-rRNA processing Urb2/Npa2 C-terminal domain-containing protein n=1 Tax=Phyllotreta striolata TaxID=444603 RepID=A0A9N9XP08_PHYSR|nr:unnamed protein product [Phyllotreta striolata]